MREAWAGRLQAATAGHLSDADARVMEREFGAPFGGDEGAEQQQQQGDIDAHEADGEEAGILEEADLVGQPADVFSSSKWDADMEKLVNMVLPYGNLMIKWPSIEDMLKGQGEELATVGLSTTEDMISILAHWISSWCFRIVPGYY
eukprot:jgi/Tetstr1/428895/TSEL_018874.t1